MTKYVVFTKASEYKGAGDSAWFQLTGTYDGANDQAAIKAALLSGAGTPNGSGDPSSEYVAVPLRSWKPRKVEAKQAFSFS